MEPSPLRRRLRSPLPGAVVEPGGLDSLPPELLNEILSRLPLRCAVRTAALARAWRHRWESVPSLRFQWPDSAGPNAIGGVLRRYSCPVREFVHFNIGKASFRRSNRWLRLLALRGVRNLHLSFERSNEWVHTLDPSIFSCHGLTVLQLHGCDIPTIPPGFTGFPNLTKLLLCNVGLPDGPRELEALISASPLLEKMCLFHLELPDSHGEYLPWAIQAPKLQYLWIDQLTDYGWQINELPSLEEAVLDVAIYSTERDFVKLMTGLVHTKKLKLIILKPPGDVNVLEGLPCPFNNLKNLSVQTSLHLLYEASYLFCLLRSAPSLEVLDIELLDDSEDDQVDSDFLNEQWTDDLFSNLIRVDVTHVMCKLSEMRFVEFVLSKARQLREFHVCLDVDCSWSNEDAVTEFLKYERASARAKDSVAQHSWSSWRICENCMRTCGCILTAGDRRLRVGHVLDCVVGNMKYRSRFKDLSNSTNVSLPPIPEPSPVL